MNRTAFENFMWDEFPSVFESVFSRQMLENILDYAEALGDESEQYNFLRKMIPQVSDFELKMYLYKMHY